MTKQAQAIKAAHDDYYIMDDAGSTWQEVARVWYCGEDGEHKKRAYRMAAADELLEMVEAWLAWSEQRIFASYEFIDDEELELRQAALKLVERVKLID